MWRKKRGTARSFVGVYGTSQRGRLGAKTCSVCRHMLISSALGTETCDGSLMISRVAIFVLVTFVACRHVASFVIAFHFFIFFFVLVFALVDYSNG